MKKLLTVIPAVALAAGLMTACDSEPATCGPQAMGPSVALQSFEIPFPEKPGGGSGGGGSGGGGGRGGSSGSSGSKPSGGGSGSKGSYGDTKPRSPSSSSGGSGYKPPAQRPQRTYHPPAGQPAPTYVQQPGGGWLPFLGGVVVGDMLNDAPEGCR